MSEAAASSADSAVGSSTKKRKRGRVSFGSDVFAAQASLLINGALSLDELTADRDRLKAEIQERRRGSAEC